MIEENHEAIVTKIDFDTVQSLLQRDVRVAPQEESVHLFSGYVHCGDCEHTMVRKVAPSRGKKYYYYVCSTHKAKLGCTSHSFSERKLNKIVLSLVQDHIQQICQLDEVLDYIAALPESQREIFNYDAQLTKLNEEIQRSVIVNLIERIIVYDAKHIEVVFRYEDQLKSALQYIERFSEII